MKEKLAIKGGKPVRESVLHYLPEEADITEDEINAVMEVLQSKKLSMLVSEKVNEFEEAFAKYCGAKHAIAVNSGTAALHVALAAAGIGPGNEVILPSFTFIATAGAILHQNLIPIFADANPKTFNIDPEKIKEKITDKTKAIIPVHLFGQPADMDPIIELAESRNITVISDSAHAIGAEYRGRKVGTLAHISCFSFYLNKHMTTGGEGGMMVTNDDELAEKASSIRNFCRPKVSPYPNVPPHKVYWGIGYSYKLTAIQAAMGIVQLRRLDNFIEKRRKNAKYLTKHIKEEIKGIKPPFVHDFIKHVYWLYCTLINEEELRISRDKFVKALQAEGISTEPYNPIPLYLQEVIRNKVGYGHTTCPFDCPLYGKKISYQRGLCPNAEKLSNQDIILPVYHTLTESDLEDIVTALKKVTFNLDQLID